MRIIVKKRELESDRRSREYAEQARRHYYEREIRDGSRFQSKAGTKDQIRKALDDAGR